MVLFCFFFFQAEDGIRDVAVTGVQTCALPIYMKNELQWKDQVGIITGAASGLGLAIAKRLSSEGVMLALFDINAKNLEMVQAQLSGKCEIYPIDLTKEEQVKAQINSIGERLGRIDILINSAGITGKTGVKTHEVSTDELRSVWEVNFM